MSVTLPLSGQVQSPVSTVLTTTNQTDIFTTPAGPASQKIIAVHFANEHTSAVEITLEWNDGSSDYTLFIKSIPTKDSVTFESAILLSSISATQKLKVTADTANVITATVVFVSDLGAQGRVS
ncbi:hypothetical protein [Roseibium album]|uniref:hypothetical protein n=1 Tax=Roseibium album TaxID=311410 RepID=UPI003BAFAADC